MSKKFNIHEWQAKRAKKSLTENDDAYQKRQDAMTPGKNPDFFYDDDSIFGKLKKDPDYIKKLNAKNTKKNVSESLNPEVSKAVNNFIKAMAKRYDYSEQDAVFAIMAALKQRNMDEMSTTGTGASFNAGSGEGYMTPNAFKKKKKK